MFVFAGKIRFPFDAAIVFASGCCQHESTPNPSREFRVANKHDGTGFTFEGGQVVDFGDVDGGGG